MELTLSGIIKIVKNSHVIYPMGKPMSGFITRLINISDRLTDCVCLSFEGDGFSL
jgi:hypothetical protein